jgi:hypothetical protein
MKIEIEVPWFAGGTSSNACGLKTDNKNEEDENSDERNWYYV